MARTRSDATELRHVKRKLKQTEQNRFKLLNLLRSSYGFVRAHQHEVGALNLMEEIEAQCGLTRPKKV